MSRAFLIALALSTSPVLVASVDCAPEDSQCVADGDASSMIQVQANAGDTDLSVTSDEGSGPMSVNMLDITNKLTNATQHLPSGLSNSIEQLEEWFGKSRPDGHKIPYGTRVKQACMSFAIYVLLALVVWYCCYPGSPVRVANPADIEDPVTTMKNGHFSCFSSPAICCCALCCPGLRWADTMSLAGFLKITTGLCVIFLASFINGFVYSPAVIVGPCTLLLSLYYRQKLREEFSAAPWACGTLCFDSLYLLFCPCCAIAQEARAVTHAIQRGEMGQKEGEVSY